MHEQRTEGDVGASPVAPADARRSRTFSRRQALGRMSAVATAGAAAWVVPEILTAKPAAGATLSHGGNGGGGSNGGTTNNPTTNPGTTTGGSGNAGTLTGTAAPTTTPGSTLAFTGIDVQRDAEIGAALIAGGWAMHHWASRTPKAAVESLSEMHEAGSADDPT